MILIAMSNSLVQITVAKVPWELRIKKCFIFGVVNAFIAVTFKTF